ncbi:hypothetical protein [Roseateles sp. P5_E7]
MTRRTHALLTLLMTAAAASTATAQSDKGFSLEAHARTRVQDVGLPAYPGATLAVERGANGEEDQSGGSFGAWMGSIGMRVDALKFKSSDKPEQVAAFYARAMARQGEVLDCRLPSSRIKQVKDEPERLSCDEKAIQPGHFEYRVGQPRHMRIVHVHPEGDGTRFEMVRLQLGR